MDLDSKRSICAYGAASARPLTPLKSIWAPIHEDGDLLRRAYGALEEIQAGERRRRKQLQDLKKRRLSLAEFGSAPSTLAPRALKQT